MRTQFKLGFLLSFLLLSFYHFPAYAVDPASETAGAESKRFEQEKDISQTIVQTGLEEQKKS